MTPSQSPPVVDQSIYDHPKYYDLVFGADCAAESRFIVQCAHAFGPVIRGGRSLRLFEPACGTGRLMDFLHRRGHDVAGLDLNPHAIDFCNARFAKRGEKPPSVVADMSQFQQRDLTSKRPFDVAFNTINSFRHLTDAKSSRDHLRCVADVLRPGGLYLLGVHLTPTTATPSDGEAWSARRGKLSIQTNMWFVDRDSKRRIERFGIYFDVHRPSGSFRINDMLVLRSYTKRQMDQFLAQSPLEPIATFDFAYDFEQPINVTTATEDVVYVLRKPIDR